jgi:hypothetical protein
VLFFVSRYKLNLTAETRRKVKSKKVKGKNYFTFYLFTFALFFPASAAARRLNNP